MRHSTDFIFDVDDATGEYGVLPSHFKDSEFNYGWSAIMLFHDLLEHTNIEGTKYFQNQFKYNIGGEIAAMGSLYYLFDEFYLSCRLNSRSRYSPEENIMETCEGMLHEGITDGYCSFGSILECKVPKQKSTDSYMEDNIIKQFNKLMSLEYNPSDTDDLDRCKEFKKSITLSKLQNLYRYGYKQAAKRYPNDYGNCGILHQFFYDLEKLCKIDLEDIRYDNPKLNITIHTGKQFKYKIKLTTDYDKWMFKN